MVLTDPQLDGYVYLAQDRARNVWHQIVKDRRGVQLGSLGTWKEATPEDITAGKETRDVILKVSADCKCGKSEVRLKLVRVDD